MTSSQQTEAPFSCKQYFFHRTGLQEGPSSRILYKARPLNSPPRKHRMARVPRRCCSRRSRADVTIGISFSCAEGIGGLCDLMADIADDRGVISRATGWNRGAPGH